MEEAQIEIGGVPVLARYRWESDDIDDLVTDGLYVNGVDIADALVSVVSRTARLARGAGASVVRDPECVLWDEVALKIAAVRAAADAAEREALAHDQAYGA